MTRELQDAIDMKWPVDKQREFRSVFVQVYIVTLGIHNNISVIL